MKKKENSETIFIAVDTGFNARYLLRTDIFRVLKDSGTRLVILTPNAEEDYFVEEFSDDNVFVEKLDHDAYFRYSQNRIQVFLRNARLHAMNGNMDLHTVDIRYNYYKKKRAQNSFKHKIYNSVFDLLVKWLRGSRSLRRLVIKLESSWFTPSIHTHLFKKYCPSKLLITSLGYFGFDHYLMREARVNGTKVISVILSWDNSSTKGMPGAFSNNVIAWTDKMKQELTNYLDLKPSQIYVGGVAHFDYHFRATNIWNKEKFYSYFNLDPNRRTLYLVLKSPNKFPWNPEIVSILMDAIEKDQFVYPCQLLVRVHPLNFRTYKGKLRFKKDMEQHYRIIETKDKFLAYDIPEILSNRLQMDMPLTEMDKVGSTLQHSDVLLCFYSTMMLEASIFDLPIVNICMYTHNEHLKKNDHQIVGMPHIQRIVETGGIRSAFNKQQFIDIINSYLSNPHLDKAERKQIKENECGPFQGSAGKAIAEHILGLQ